MVSKRVYNCDICRCSIQDDQHGIGIYWISHPKEWKKKSLRDAEHHLCDSCFYGLERMIDVHQGRKTK